MYNILMSLRDFTPHSPGRQETPVIRVFRHLRVLRNESVLTFNFSLPSAKR
jgi:hypothetical protein